DRLADERLDLVLEGLAVQPHLVEAAAVDQHPLGAGEGVLEDAGDDVFPPQRLRLGRPAGVVLGEDADDLEGDRGDHRAGCVVGDTVLHRLLAHRDIAKIAGTVSTGPMEISHGNSAQSQGLRAEALERIATTLSDLYYVLYEERAADPRA